MNAQQRKEIEEILADLPQEDAQETLRAIVVGEVDALVVDGSKGPAVYTLKDANHPYRVIIERMSEGAVVLGDDGTILYCNRSFAAFVGFDKRALLGRPVSAFIAPEHHRRLASVLVLARTSPAATELDLAGRQGGLPVYLSASPIEIDEWKSCIALVITDLTMRRRSEYIAAAEEFARSVLDQATEPIIVCDADGIVTHSSLAAQSLCSSSPLGRRYEDAFPVTPTFGEGERGASAGAGNSGGVEVQMACRGGEMRYFVAREGNLKDAHGVTMGRIVTLADITDRKKAEETLLHYHDRLEAMVVERTAELLSTNRDLEGFTYAASHDIRGPLGRINSFCTLLSERFRSRLDGDGILFLDLIQQNARRVLSLVEDLLAHAQISHQPVELQPVDVLAAIDQALHESAQDIGRNGAEIRLELPDRLVALSTPLGLSQVLRNLLENALKYSAQAKPPVIEIGGQVQGDVCRLWVRDNGIGIEKAYQERVFEIFRRLHTYGEYPGNGIGLALVKKAVEMMDGKVWVESEPGQGATFFVELGAVA